MTDPSESPTTAHQYRAARLGLSVLVLAILGSTVMSGCTLRKLRLIPPKMEKHRVDPARFPDADAVYIYDVGWTYHQTRSLAGNPLAYHRQARIQLISRAATEGDRFGNISIRHVGDLLDLSAYVEKPDGTRVVLGPDDIHTMVSVKDVLPGAIPAVDLNITTLVFPDLNPGDIVGYRFTRHFGEWSWRFNRLGAPVVYSSFTIEKLFKKFALQAAVSNLHGLKIEKAIQSAATTAYLSPHESWIARDVPPLPDELLRPPIAELASRIDVYYRLPKIDLDRLALAYRDWLTNGETVADHLVGLAQKTAAGVESVQEKARTITRWLFDNVAIVDSGHLTEISPAYHTPPLDLKRVVDTRRATAEEAAALLWALLKAAGVDCEIVLVSPEGHPGLNSELHDITQFTHVLLALDDQTLVDVTDRWLPFGRAAGRFQARLGMWVATSGRRKARIPAMSADVNLKRTRLTAVLTSEGKLTVQVEVEFQGLAAARARREASVEAQAAAKSFARAWLEAVEQAQSSAQDPRLEGLNKLEQPLVLRFSFVAAAGLVEEVGQRYLIKPGALLAVVRPPPLSADRKLPVRFPQRLTEEVDLVVQANGRDLRAATEPASERFGGDAAQFHVQTTVPANDSIALSRRFQVLRREVAPEGAPDLARDIARFNEQLSTTIAVER